MKKLSVFLLASVVLVGCNEAPEPVQSVEWYKEHKSERAERLATCRANPGDLATTPNCLNAEQAESLADAAKRGGLNVQPMTDIKLGR